MISVGFERVYPVPSYPTGVTEEILSGYDWSSRANAVVKFKLDLKNQLRIKQLGRCCYCRRLLGDSIDTDIEHYIEKSAFTQFSFSIQNLALSCSTCNSKKNSAFIRLSSFFSRRAKITSGAKNNLYKCPTLSVEVLPKTPLPSTSVAYRWIHPHFDEYSKNLKILKGWVYKPTSRKGYRTVHGLQLNALGAIERRMRLERLASKPSIFSAIIATLAEMDKDEAKILAQDLVLDIKRRRCEHKDNL